MKEPKKAAAIAYDPERDRAPRVTARGRHKMAEKIIAVAEANGIPIRQDRQLAPLLEALDIDDEIPPDLYRAVAEVLVFIYRLNDEKMGRSSTNANRNTAE